MGREMLLLLLWAIFIAEGHVKASVPFGWIKRKKDWKEGKVSFFTVMKEVASELRIEFAKWRKANESGKYGGDFIHWLARVGYNANPNEWVAWERNVRHYFNLLSQL